MRIRDTLSRSEHDVPRGTVGIYLCGVTVYDDAHIGHARTIIVFDVLRRYLEYTGRSVRMIQNFTDVDDKIIRRAADESVEARELAARYMQRYREDFERLNVLEATEYPRATEHISEMHDMISRLIDGGFAYVAKNGVYFAVSRYPEYGRLSGKDTDELCSGARVEVDDSKSNPLDFALWKFAKDGPRWQSPWGEGRPGWHIECSAMSIKYLGSGFEIHGGGRDLIFPHHENEIAQSEAASGEPFARTWMHVGMVTIDGEKMSKSLGNAKSVREMLELAGANVSRLFCLSADYAKPLDYTDAAIQESIAKWRQVETAHHELLSAANSDGGSDIDAARFAKRFDCALEKNLDTRGALDALYGISCEINKLAAKGLAGTRAHDSASPEFGRMMGILGLYIQDVKDERMEEIEGMIRKRRGCRDAGDYGGADAIRGEAARMGVELLDHPNYTTWIQRERIPAEAGRRDA